MTSRDLTLETAPPGIASGPAASFRATTPRPLSLRSTLLAVATLTIMAGTIVAPALPAIREVFAGQEGVELLSRMVLTLPAIFVAFFAPVVGTLADRFGRKKLLVTFIALYVVAGMSGLVADSLISILVGRAALGLAIAAIMTIGAALVGDYFEGEERSRFFGLQLAFTQIGGVVFVIAGGVLADMHWRAPFAVYGLGLLILPAAALFLIEPSRPARTAQPREHQQDRLNWLPVLLVCLLAFLVNALFYTIPSQIAFFLRDALQMTQPSMAGLAIGLLNLAGAITGFGYGSLRARLDLTATFGLGLALMAAGFAWLSFASGAVGVFGALAVVGFGLGFSMPNVMSAAVQVGTPATRARVTGLVTSSMFLGHFVSPIAAQPIIAAIDYAGLYLVVAMVLALTVVIVLLSRMILHRLREPA
ncbi:MFS transporter [Mesorhizobium australicum]|uniref:Predicted arabinose efflux permease, MFS family n=1 Tax=Mesorhizobium australicum TaxID=536018 RepID=A0A1X7NX54_9HYPH|nr:MFS transporter [Mesorhizobium australicum]SMH41891.1 Predicted arabinose efflux permease, MFS family [Mesorhizobium australicum]